MTTGEIEDAYIVEGGVNGDVFETFVRRSLLPILQPFNGSNPCSVVILDNASIHHLEQIEDIITGVGALIRFMPSYSLHYYIFMTIVLCTMFTVKSLKFMHLLYNKTSFTFILLT